MAQEKLAPKPGDKEWRIIFSPEQLEKAEKMLRKKSLYNFSCDESSARGDLNTIASLAFHVEIKNAPRSFTDDWYNSTFQCSCGTKRNVTIRIGGSYRYLQLCQHMAALLMAWEQQHGPWRFEETPEERAARMHKEEVEREKARRREQKKKEQKTVLDAVSFFPEGERDGTYFDIPTAVANLRTNLYYVNRARALLEEGTVSLGKPELVFGQDGAQALSVRGTVKDAVEKRTVTLVLGQERLERHSCGCTSDSYGWEYGYTLCNHELVLLTKLREYVRANDPGDATDLSGARFFIAMDSTAARQETAEAAEQARSRTLTLSPRVLGGENGDVELTFKAGLAGGKQIQLRNIRDFLMAVSERTPFPLSKTITLDFSSQDFTEESLPWLTFLQRRVSETDTVNDRLQRRAYYVPTLAVKTRDALSGATLDRFYELAENHSVEYQDKLRGIDGAIRVEHRPLRLELETERISGAGGGFAGVTVTGTIPRILRGSAGSYILSEEALSRITPEEEQFLKPFQEASIEGRISFRVGKNRLAEFYYRVAPRLTGSPYVALSDPCAAEAETLLPPEPVFTFRLDVDETAQRITCAALVAYGAEKPTDLGARKGYRDEAQEKRVMQVLQAEFDGFDNRRRLWYAPYSDERLYQVLTESSPALSRYGMVEGSEAIESSRPRAVPAIRVGVSIESGLLELEVLTRDMSAEELLEVLDSYRQKKKYHRLRSGAFVDLAGDRQLSDLEALSDGLNLDLAQTIREGAELPLYRSLYLDTLLEAHDELVSSRDRVYRALLKNFKTIRDADYEVPQAQAEVMRSYQVYGYKWLRTLAAAGFGGILADEMGLGKTLQTIALFQALREEGDAAPFLVVCPASLVYNWQEECSRFAPGLEVHVMTGTAAVRKKHLAEVREAGAVLCIASYDLLRQDIAEYSALRFSTVVLDEAQYIKNQKAAMTRAVKAIRAERRFALTGTPIENRLAELWSIFDFLMPGFLYGYTEFSRRFESPITKQKDPEATARLKQMTGPFILRRRKAEVLKDLPAKLEEVRFTRFEEAQRKVYDGQVIHMRQVLLSGGNTGEDRVRIFAELLRIRQICCDPGLLLEDYHGGSAKREACMELVHSAMSGGHRMLLFSQFTSMLALLEEDLKAEGIPCFKLTGATPKEQRLQLVREFNEGDVPVFLISLKAGGTGLNLTGADVVIHYDPWWNLAAQNQATDRAHRIGQENEVTVYRIIVKDTIEEKILALQEAKRDLADAVLSGEGSSITALSNEELLALLG